MWLDWYVCLIPCFDWLWLLVVMMNVWMKRNENGQAKCLRTKHEAWWKNDDMSCMDDWIEPWMIILNACDGSVTKKLVCYLFFIMIFRWLLVRVCLMIWVILVGSCYVMIVWIFVFLFTCFGLLLLCLFKEEVLGWN